MGKVKQNLNVAMIGQGFMGRAHSNAFQQVNRFFEDSYNVVPKVICGRDRRKLEEMASRWGWQEIETEWAAVVQRKDIDVVDVAVPNHLHAEIAIAAARAGKIVLCEKPLAMTLDEAVRMVEAARHVPTLVWFNYRRVPAISLAKRLIGEGRLGEVFHYRAKYLQSWGLDTARAIAWRFKRAEAGSGAVGDLLAHLLDGALFLNGRITEVCAITQTFVPGRDVDDAGLVLARFENGSVGTFEATRFATGRYNQNNFEIHGSQGMLGFDLEDMNHLEYFDAKAAAHVQGTSKILVTGNDHPYVSNFWPPGHIIGYEHTFIATLADFLTALEKDEPFHTNFEDALEVQRLLDAVERSANGAAWVKLSRDGNQRLPSRTAQPVSIRSRTD